MATVRESSLRQHRQSVLRDALRAQPARKPDLLEQRGHAADECHVRIVLQIQRNRQLEIRFAGSPEAGMSLIRSDPKVRDVQMNHRSCTVEIEGEDSDIERLLRQLVSADCGLVSFADKEPTLEDVFMLVTKGLVS